MKEETKKLIERPPVVVVMGHIDHGKSKILDYIRNANVVEKEAGGITQHIGAYETEVKRKRITFLDTPGHEAFSQMRQRGAKIADVAVLVVASDEGVKPQTIEAYEIIEESKIPFVIALNKIDKPNSDPERIKSQLAEKQILVEGYGGKVPTVNVSAKTGEGIDNLLDMILLLAEMENLQADPEENASGFVIESHLDPRRGISATLLIQNGTIKRGMFVVSGEAIAPVRIFENFLGQPLEEASFSSPIKIIGFDKMPETGAEFKTFNTREEADIAKVKPSFFNKGLTFAEAEGKTTLSLVLKTDVTGSLEALEKEIIKKETENIKIKILRKDVGDINEDDVKLASSGKNPVILGFNIKIDGGVKELSERLGVITFLSPIIYEISDWFENEIRERDAAQRALSGGKEILGTAKILKTFSQTKNKQLIGGRVVSGKIIESKIFKIKRGESEIGGGKIISLQKNKTPVKEANEGDEFGAMVESKTEIAQDDVLEII